MLLNFGSYLFSFILIISIIVFVHEFGHYFFAKLFKVKVEVFSIGFGKELFGTTDKAGTRWKFSLIPAGGYVKIFGDSNEASTPDNKLIAELNEEEKKKVMHLRPIYQKALIAIGGPLANLIFAFMILWGLFFYLGKPTIEPIITNIKVNSAAEKAGLQLSDKITAINGTKVSSFEDVKRILSLSVDSTLEIEGVRNNENFKATLVPEIIQSKDFLGNTIEVPFLGILAEKISYINTGVFNSAYFSLQEMSSVITSTIKVIGQMIVGKRDTKDLGGPIRIAKYSGQSLQKGFFTICWFLAMLSINLGVVNLLPIPMLDGGHLLFYLVEFIKGPKAALKYQEYATKVGMAFLITLFVFVTFNDIKYLLK